MYILGLSSQGLLLIVLITVLFINFGCILFLVLKERKEDQDEIDELVSEIENKVEKNSDNKIKSKEVEEKYIEKINKDEEEMDKKVLENKSEIEEMLEKMQKDLDAKPEDVVTSFENEQEEKSIISYQELVNSVKEQKEKNNAKVHIAKFENEEKDDNIKLEISMPDKKESAEVIKRFKNTEFISPIFGKQDGQIKYPTVPKKDEVFEQRSNNKLDELNFSTDDSKLEETIDVKPLKREMEKNDQFLKFLKEFRKNLD